ncbi:MAG TPA: hypothetical protein VLN59_06070 [Burkholderiales bacterium]|nr:hypothetical protein [Burkholderiales bacterium]
MKRWIFRFDTAEDGSSYWRWEERDDDKLIQESSMRFVEWAECVADATLHGYTHGEGSPPAPPNNHRQ